MTTKTKRASSNPRAAAEADAIALVGELVQVQQDAAKLQTELDGTAKGRRLLELKKEAEALKEKLRETLEPLKLVNDKPIQTPYGPVGFTLRRSRAFSPVAVRELVPSLAQEVVYEAVDAKALEALIKLKVKHKKLAGNTLQLLEDHPETKVLRSEQDTWAFTCPRVVQKDEKPRELAD